ncbi:MAG: thiamine-phosphate kinase [Microcoleaceae cyanobacterium]
MSFQKLSNLRVCDLKEQELLKTVQRFCPADVVGDDAALLMTHLQKQLVVTTDMLVDQVHFSDRTTTATDVGWRAVAANLSDLAAMGATPLGITVALSLPGETSVSWVEDCYQGMSDCLRSFQTPIVGGDLCRSSVRSIAITAFGEVDQALAIRRSVGQAGDVILVTGHHGSSRAGLELLLQPELATKLVTGDSKSLIQAHQRPLPRLDVVTKLSEIFAACPGLRIAGMDSSDGLADAVIQICRASGIGARIVPDQIPISKVLKKLVPSDKALEWALYGGEDFELVLFLPTKAAEDLLRLINGQATIVGIATLATEILLVDHLDPNHATWQRELSLEQGFQHF